IALRIERNAFVRFASIFAASETVEDGMTPTASRGRQLENRAAAEVSSLHRRTVNVSPTVHHQVGIEVFAVAASGETIDHFGRAGGSDARCDPGDNETG